MSGDWDVITEQPLATTSAMEQRHSAIERAVHNSPPPLDDVGGIEDHLFDPFDPYRPVEALLDERQKTHGSFQLNAYWGQELRELFRRSPGWHHADNRQREALDYIAGKLARILSGQPAYADHWDDIAGYAKLAAHP